MRFSDSRRWTGTLGTSTRSCRRPSIRQKLSPRLGRCLNGSGGTRTTTDCSCEHLRCRYLGWYRGPEFTAHRVRDWLQSVEVKTLFIEPGSPWENGYVESFNGKL